MSALSYEMAPVLDITVALLAQPTSLYPNLKRTSRISLSDLV